MAKSPKKAGNVTIRLSRTRLIAIVVVVLMLYVVIPQVGAFRHSLSLLATAHPVWVGAAALAYLATGLSSVFIYRTLLPRRLPLVPTIIVEYGSSFANRLVPAGIGALGVNIVYFKKRGCSTAQAVAAVTLNNVFGIIGHGILVVLVLLLMPGLLQALELTFDTTNTIILAVGAILAVLLLVIGLRIVKTRIIGIVRQTLVTIAAYRHRPAAVVTTLLLCMSITCFHATCIWASGQALDINVSFAQAIIVLAIGVGAGAIIPSPGGLGGAEAGLVAALLAFHVDASQAVALAILYRLASYWLGFAVGGFGFWLTERRGYI
jgi:undecaprenyl-diphosphatase